MKARRFLATLTAAALAVSLAACSADSSTGGEIIVGMDEDSTGPGASYATIAGATTRLAIKEINDAGGIKGKKIKLIVGNDESDPTKTPTVVRKLVDDGAQFLILNTGGGAVLQGKATLKQAGIPAIAPIAVTPAIGQAPDNEFIFMQANGVDQFGEVYCGAIKKKGYTKIGILSDASASITSINKTLIPALSGCVKVVAQETAPVDAADLSAQVARIKQASPDVLLVSSLGGNFEVLAQNTLASQMPNLIRFSLASIGNQPDSWARMNPGALSNVVYMGSLDSNNSKTVELEKKLKAANGSNYRMTAYDAQAYDAVYLMKAAIEKAGGAEKPVEVRDALQGVSGYKASFGQNGFTLSFSPTKHIGADGLCGLVLSGFDSKNQPTGAWSEYQAPCTTK